MTDLEKKILEQIKKGVLKPSLLAKKLNISRQALHRYLKAFTEQKKIKKQGSGPHVTYHLTSQESESRIEESIEFFKSHLLPKYLKKQGKKMEKNYADFLKRTSKQANLDPSTPLRSAQGNRIMKFGFMLDSAALYSSKIEGNSLNLNSFLNSRMQAKKHRPKEAQEIEDLLKAYQFSQTEELNERNMLKAHGILSKDFVTKSRQGKYRQEPVGVFSSRGMEYLAIEPALVASEMKVFFDSIIELKKINMNPSEGFFWASWIHLTMALVHPFADGNGRIARLCEKWFLKEQLGLEVYFLPSEEHYFLNHPAYYQSLKLGVNYWEVDFGGAMGFLEMLPNTLKI